MEMEMGLFLRLGWEKGRWGFSALVWEKGERGLGSVCMGGGLGGYGIHSILMAR